MKTIKKDSMIWKSFSFWNMLLNQKPEASSTYCGFIFQYIFTVLIALLLCTAWVGFAGLCLLLTYMYTVGAVTLMQYIALSSPLLIIIIIIGCEYLHTIWLKIRARCTPLRIE